jgi:hypothetical protein
MRIFSYLVSKAVVNDFGLNHPERFQLHVHSRLGLLATTLFNYIMNRDVLYVVWRHDVHLTTWGAWFLSKDALPLEAMRGLLQEADRGNAWKALFRSFKEQR